MNLLPEGYGAPQTADCVYMRLRCFGGPKLCAIPFLNTLSDNALNAVIFVVAAFNLSANVGKEFEVREPFHWHQ